MPLTLSRERLIPLLCAGNLHKIPQTPNQGCPVGVRVARGVRFGSRVRNGVFVAVVVAGFVVAVAGFGVRVKRAVLVNSGVSVTGTNVASGVLVSEKGVIVGMTVAFGSNVAFGSGVNSSVGVLGARVGIGACVGVASSVLPGKFNVGGGAVWGTEVGRITVGMEMTTVAGGGGVATSVE